LKHNTCFSRWLVIKKQLHSAALAGKSMVFWVVPEFEFDKLKAGNLSGLRSGGHLRSEVFLSEASQKLG